VFALTAAILRRGFLHRVHCRRLSPLSTRMRSLRRELLFGRCANETSSWIRPLALLTSKAHQFLERCSRAQRRLGMAIDAVGTLRYVGDRDRNDLLGLCRERAVGKDGFASASKAAC
jgi:hypothetical protein